MNLIKPILSITVALLFSACGEDATTTPLTDVQSVHINEINATMYSTDSNISLSSTVYFSDGSSKDATESVTWNSSNVVVATASIGTVSVGTGNGGDANLSVSYENLTSDSIPLRVIKLVDYNLSIPGDLNTTGTHSLLATGLFEDNATRSIVKKITWLADNGAIIVGEGNLTTITVLIGDTNVTSTVSFDDLNVSKTLIITIN